MMTIFIAIVLPSSKIITDDQTVTIQEIEKDYSVSDFVSSPIDSLIGINDGETIKASNQGVANGAINLVLLILAIGSFVSICTKVGIFDQIITMIISSNLSIQKVTVLLIIYFVTCATTFGLYESAVCYIPLLITLYKRYGVSPLYAIKLLILSVSVGYIASPINPFATIIADQIANNQTNLFGFRSLLLLVLVLSLIIYLCVELKRINPQVIEKSDVSTGEQVKYINIALFLMPYIYMTIGFIPSLLFSATMATVTIGFIASGIIIGLTNRMTLTETIDNLFGGVNNFMIIAVSITLARTVYIILFNSHVIDTIVYHIVMFISPFSDLLIVIGLCVLFLLLGYIIPSPSALAMITLPIIAPALELVGISIASTVTIFLMTHGLSKMYAMTSPLVIASLNEAGVTYKAYLSSIKDYMYFVYVLVIILAVVAL